MKGEEDGTIGTEVQATPPASAKTDRRRKKKGLIEDAAEGGLRGSSVEDRDGREGQSDGGGDDGGTSGDGVLETSAVSAKTERRRKKKVMIGDVAEGGLRAISVEDRGRRERESYGGEEECEVREIPAVSAKTERRRKKKILHEDVAERGFRDSSVEDRDRQSSGGEEGGLGGNGVRETPPVSPKTARKREKKALIEDAAEQGLKGNFFEDKIGREGQSDGGVAEFLECPAPQFKRDSKERRNRSKHDDAKGQVPDSTSDVQVEESNDELGIEVPTTKKSLKRSRNHEVAELGHDSNLFLKGGNVGDNVLSGESEAHASTLKKRKKKLEDNVVIVPLLEELDPPEEEENKKRKKKKRPEAIIFSNEPDGHVPETKGQTKVKKRVRFEVPEEEKSMTHIGDSVISGDDATHFGWRNWKRDLERFDLRYGRFTKEEDATLKENVYRFIRGKRWNADEGTEKLLHPMEHTEARGAWLEIARCLPQRPVKQIYARGQRILSSEKRGKWSEEESNLLKKLQAEHGNDWKTIATHLGRPAQLCKDRWRIDRVLDKRRTGFWTKEEHDRLCTLVRENLRLRATLGGKKPDRRVEVRDDLQWDFIGEKMLRPGPSCSVIWYSKLASPMIAEGRWGNEDDRHMLRRLMEIGASSEEALDWDEVLDHREGWVCLERWNEMLKLLGDYKLAPFEDKLERLARRYAPDLLGIEEESVFEFTKTIQDVD